MSEMRVFYLRSRQERMAIMKGLDKIAVQPMARIDEASVGCWRIVMTPRASPARHKGTTRAAAAHFFNSTVPQPTTRE